MRIGVPRETWPGERRVALVPDGVAALRKAGLTVAIERGAGDGAGIPDDAFVKAGAEMADRGTAVGSADIVLTVRAMPADAAWKSGQTVIGFADPLGDPAALTPVAQKGVTLLSMELMPRTTRAQSMDALSSMATVAGYKAVLLAADALPRMFPMMMTAAGTISPAKVFIVGAGVAGLQAISMAKRLGAKVEAYDVRPAAKEQVQSLGAKFVELPLEAGSTQDAGGYAKAMDEAFYKRQREMMAAVVANADIVVATAAVPGKKAPVLVTAEMVAGMKPGSVVVDIAAEQGGNCELTRPGERVEHKGVTVLGPLNLASSVPNHASFLWSKNLANFLALIVKDGALTIDAADPIVAESLVARNGDVVGPRVREALGLPALVAAPAAS